MTEDRFKKAEFGARIGIVGNIALALMKGFVGYASNSKALIADALHSASNVVGSIVVLAGIRSAKLPPDEENPYSHGKAQPIAAIIVSVLLLVIGIEIGISSAKAIYYGVNKPPSSIALVAIVISIVVKEAMYQYKYRLGKKLSNQALTANSWEHRSDVYSSIAALIGVGGARLGDYLGNTALYYLDPIAGFFVSLLVLRMGYRLVMESIHSTMDHVLHQEDSAELLGTVQRIKGVIAVDDFRAREHGHYVIVDIKISVNPKISVQEGHDIAKIVKHTLMKRFIHVSDVFIHVNPYDPGYPYKNAETEPDDHPTLLH